MRALVLFPFVMVAALLVPADAFAQGPWPRGGSSLASDEGYARGVRAGEDDARRGQSYDARDELEYRRADAGYRPQYGSVDRYRDEFRRAFENGYAEGYRRGGGYGRGGYPGGNPGGGYPGSGYPGGYGRGGWNDGPAYPGRGGGPGNPNLRYDLAFRTGVNDGYERGLDDGRDGRRFDPIAESRYRSGDHGYERRYGSKDLYKARYRDGFVRGYEEGYVDGQRYDRRYDGRYDRRQSRPWWWPF
jgi:hypothetical protein